MHKRTVLYRGSLKSCNYSCSYCPFAKHKALASEMERDRQNFARFCDSIVKRAQPFSIGAVFITPYGEASLHRWYWEGLSRLAEIPGIDRVGMQTNLSFSVEECLEIFDSFGEKLSVWATFHPEMTTVDVFVAKCHSLIENNIMVCAGAVGDPHNTQVLRELRERLSPAVYLWINRMDGLKRKYRSEEAEAFAQIDPFFGYELGNPEAAVQMCADRCFVEADGKIHTCNISGIKAVNWYDGSEEELFGPACSRKRCTCYLAYSGRSDYPLKNIFGEYPVYRIPRKFKAIFFDLDGTLISADGICDVSNTVYQDADVICKESDTVRQNQDAIYTRSGASAEDRRGKGFPDQVRKKLDAVREICPVFLATSMPEADVKRRLKADMDLFRGFIFASGGCVCLRDENGGRERIYPVDTGSLSEAIEFGKSVKAKPAIYEKNGTTYKVTLIKGHHSVWKDTECDRMEELLKESGCRFFTEKNCLEIVNESRNKGRGIEEICGWLGICPGDVLAVGNDKEDAAMEEVCGAYINLGVRQSGRKC